MSGCDTSTTKKKCMPVHTTFKEVKCRRKLERKKERETERKKGIPKIKCLLSS